MAQVGVTVHRGMAQMKFSAAQTKPWAGSPPRLPANTVLLPALQMLRAFPAGPDQAQKGNYEARLKKKNNKNITAFLQAGGKMGEGKDGGSTSVSAPLQCTSTYHPAIVIEFNSQITWMSKKSAKTFSIKQALHIKGGAFLS